MGMKIITPAGQAHSLLAIIYRHPLDKVLAFGIQWKFESYRWKCGRRNNVCVLGANVSEAMFLRKANIVRVKNLYNLSLKNLIFLCEHQILSFFS